MFKKLKALGVQARREPGVYQRVLADTRTPRAARLLLALAVGYLLMPFDIIPDFLPVIGHLDDLVIVPLLVWLALRMIPEVVIADCRAMKAGRG